MIVGTGLLATAFNMYKDCNKVLIFASGVSNSAEQNDGEFEREINLLETFIDTDMKLVYFGTTSIYDEDFKHSKYIKHKTFIENTIVTHSKNYIIFRLPTVIGISTNKNTFFNGITDAIINGNVHIKNNAVRYLIDIDSLSQYLPPIINTDKNCIMNVCFNNKAYVKDIVSLMGSIMKKDYLEHIIDGGYEYEINNSEFISKIPTESIENTNFYTYNTLKKYLI